MEGELVILEICREYGWTYLQYLSNPEWFNHAALEKLIIDRKPQHTASRALQ